MYMQTCYVTGGIKPILARNCGTLGRNSGNVSNLRVCVHWLGCGPEDLTGCGCVDYLLNSIAEYILKQTSFPFISYIYFTEISDMKMSAIMA